MKKKMIFLKTFSMRKKMMMIVIMKKIVKVNIIELSLKNQNLCQNKMIDLKEF